MKKTIKDWSLQPGDRIIGPKSYARWIQHHAIYLGIDEKGRDIFAENKSGVGVQIVTSDVFFADFIELTRIEKFIGDIFQRNATIKRALSLRGKAYDLLNFNCEHYCNFVQYNTVKSEQAKTGIVLGLVALVAGVIFLS